MNNVYNAMISFYIAGGIILIIFILLAIFAKKTK